MSDPLPVVRSLPAPGTDLCGMAWDGQHLWHSDAGTQRIYRLNPAGGEVDRELECPDVRTDMSWDPVTGRIWQIAGRPKRIRVIDSTDGAVVDEIDLGAEAERACGLLVLETEYWIGYKDLGRVQLFSRRKHTALTQLPALPHVDGLAWKDGALWYTSFGQQVLVAIDPGTGKELVRHRLPGDPTGMTCDGELFWFSDYANGRICAVRPG